MSDCFEHYVRAQNKIERCVGAVLRGNMRVPADVHADLHEADVRCTHTARAIFVWLGYVAVAEAAYGDCDLWDVRDELRRAGLWTERGEQ